MRKKERLNEARSSNYIHLLVGISINIYIIRTCYNLEAVHIIRDDVDDMVD